MATYQQSTVTEFIWKSDSSGTEIKLRYFFNEQQPYVSIVDEHNREVASFEYSFFEEVYHFISNTEKATVAKPINPKKNFANLKNSSVKGSLALPKVLKGGQVEEDEDQEPIEPIQSFANLDVLAKNTSVTSPKVSKTAIPEEAYQRPVIRASSIEESNMLRGSSKKTIRKVE